MSHCASCGRECNAGSTNPNATLLNPANWNDRRIVCDRCRGIKRDDKGRVVNQEDMVIVLSGFREVRG